MNRTHLLVVAALLLAPATASAQAPRSAALATQAAALPAGPQVLEAVRLAGEEPIIDGTASEAVWAQAPVAGDFRQFEPKEGEPASQRTEARVLYGNDALFVTIRAFDSAPDSIQGQLTRRDQNSYSDQVAVIIDSYFDKRTAFHFAVNPVGVKSDIYRFNDTNEDSNWDAVWDAATSRDAEGWTAEFRIPYSQLRFREGAVQTWGINFTRKIARHEEETVWADTRRSESKIVSKFGELRGLRDLSPPRRIEIMPYSLAKLDRAPGDESDPFYSKNEFSSAVGADVKVGVTSSLTLDLTLNPDFGQVEADPSQVNLGVYETFLSERRPFFVEGSNLFNFTDFGIFYSRRVGRPPQGFADPGANGYADTPDQSTILGAAKLSGKTASGWSIGVMDALTSEESAELAPAIGPRREEPVEPLTNYLVARVSKDFRAGKSTVGGIATAVTRDGEIADRFDLRSRALSAGLDARHRFSADNWELAAWAIGTRVEGSEEAIAQTQLSSARYFDRPDAEHVSFDPTRTSLSGLSAGMNINKISGGHWRWGGGLNTRSPGFESNDAGFMGNTDFINPWVYAGYDQATPQGIFRRWRLNFNGWDEWTYGGEHSGPGGNVNGNFQLSNFWGGYGGFGYNATGYSWNLLRGGESYRKEESWHTWYGFNSDNRKKVQASFNGWWDGRFDSESFSYGFSPEVSFRPSGRAQISVGANYNHNQEDVQWVRRFGTGPDATYVFGRIDQSTVGLTTRMDLAFTPTLTLQLYASPFVSAGTYGDFRRITDPKAIDYDDRFAPIATRLDDGTYYSDLTSEPGEESFGNPDFNFRQFNSNAVLRWEYRPGSALFVVWAQGRDSFSQNGAFDLGRDMDNLFSAEARNILMVKMSYWINP